MPQATSSFGPYLVGVISLFQKLCQMLTANVEVSAESAAARYYQPAPAQLGRGKSTLGLGTNSQRRPRFFLFSTDRQPTHTRTEQVLPLCLYICLC